MIERRKKLPSHLRILATFWLFNAIVIGALFLFVIRGWIITS